MEASSSASEFGYCSSQQQQQQFTPAAKPSSGAGDFVVEDLLDFSNDDDVIAGVNDDGTFDNLTAGNSTDSSSVLTPVDSCNSPFSGGNNDLGFPPTAGDIGCRSFSDSHFSSDLCVPYDDLAELEWLSNFVEESFSSEDLQKLQLISGMSAMKARPGHGPDEASETRPANNSDNSLSSIFGREMPVPGKARSKRSRAAPCNWTSRLLVLSPATNPTPNPTQPARPEPDQVPTIKPTKSGSKKKGGFGSGMGMGMGPTGSSSELVGGSTGEVRKCLHCATDKTPQWRTGPMGPKTLCNACGVRYKSGRLVPEYRPAASPTFVLTKHSNSHRKVMELRRQKELMKQQQLHHHHHNHQPPPPQQQQYQQQLIHHQHSNSMMFDLPNSDDYLIHQHIGPDFRQLI